MTFSRPLRMSWLIVGIVPFKTTPPTGTAGGGRKNKVLSPKRGAHHTEEALAVKRRCRTVSRLAVWPPSGILDTGARQKPHDAARLRRSRHQRHHRHRHLPPPREGLPQRGGPLLGGLAGDRRCLPAGRALFLRDVRPLGAERRALPLRPRRIRPMGRSRRGMDGARRKPLRLWSGSPRIRPQP